MTALLCALCNADATGTCGNLPACAEHTITDEEFLALELAGQIEPEDCCSIEDCYNDGSPPTTRLSSSLVADAPTSPAPGSVAEFMAELVVELKLKPKESPTFRHIVAPSAPDVEPVYFDVASVTCMVSSSVNRWMYEQVDVNEEILAMIMLNCGES